MSIKKRRILRWFQIRGNTVIGKSAHSKSYLQKTFASSSIKEDKLYSPIRKKRFKILKNVFYKSVLE